MSFDPYRASLLSVACLLTLSLVSDIATYAPEPDVSPVGRQCLTERRTYCAPDMTSCHTERDFYWLAAEAGACPVIVDTIPRDVPPTPVFKCMDDAGVWYSWAPCDEEPDPVNA